MSEISPQKLTLVFLGKTDTTHMCTKVAELQNKAGLEFSLNAQRHQNGPYHVRFNDAVQNQNLIAVVPAVFPMADDEYTQFYAYDRDSDSLTIHVIRNDFAEGP